jgi:hypothetical protein
MVKITPPGLLRLTQACPPALDLLLKVPSNAPQEYCTVVECKPQSCIITVLSIWACSTTFLRAHG